MRPSLDQYLMEVAKLAATRTTCIRRGVGCVLANARGHILAVGYNGVAAGMPHCNEVSDNSYIVPEDLRASPEAVFGMMLKDMPHIKKESVQRYSLKPHRLGETALQFTWAPHACKGHDLPSGQDSCEAVHAEQNALLQCHDPWEIETAYVTLSPCKACLKLLLNTSCQRIVVLEEHVDLMPRELWLRTGRTWEVLYVPPQ